MNLGYTCFEVRDEWLEYSLSSTISGSLLTGIWHFKYWCDKSWSYYKLYESIEANDDTHAVANDVGSDDDGGDGDDDHDDFIWSYSCFHSFI